MNPHPTRSASSCTDSTLVLTAAGRIPRGPEPSGPATRVPSGHVWVGRPGASGTAPARRSGRGGQRGTSVMSERLVADLLVERLRAWGVSRLFGYSGDG